MAPKDFPYLTDSRQTGMIVTAQKISAKRAAELTSNELYVGLMGAVLVFGQLIGALMGNGAMVLGLNTALKTYSIWVASICAFSGLIMSDTREKKKK